MHVHKLLQAELASAVHARHPGFQCRLALLIGVVAQMLKVSGGEETILVGHGVDLLADVSGRHGLNMTAQVRNGKSGGGTQGTSMEAPPLDTLPNKERVAGQGAFLALIPTSYSSREID